MAVENHQEGKEGSIPKNIYTAKAISERIDALITEHGATYSTLDMSGLNKGLPVEADVSRCLINGIQIAFVVNQYLAQRELVDKELMVTHGRVFGFDQGNGNKVFVEFSEFVTKGDESTRRFEYQLGDGNLKTIPEDISVERQKQIADIVGVKHE